MADNFNFKQFLMENRLGVYSKVGSMEEAGSSTAHDMVKKAMNAGKSPEEAAEELEVAGIDPMKIGRIVDDVYSQGLSADLEMGDDDDDDFNMFEAGVLKVDKDGNEI